MSAADVGGLVAGVVGAATGVGALVVAAAGERRARRAERNAQEATDGAASLEVSLQRIADNTEQDRALRERDLDATVERLMQQLPQLGLDLSAVLTRPPHGSPEFNVEFVRGHAYRLRNVGTVAATGVDISVLSFPEALTRGMDGTVDLAPMASTEPFVIQGSFQAPPPGEIVVSCAELAEPVTVPLPPRS